jgi:hypothetical protein
LDWTPYRAEFQEIANTEKINETYVGRVRRLEAHHFQR